jgi:hypothetical protein
MCSLLIEHAGPDVRWLVVHNLLLKHLNAVEPIYAPAAFEVQFTEPFVCRVMICYQFQFYSVLDMFTRFTKQIVVEQFEQIFFGKISTGAQNDLQQVTKMSYAMVTVYGMSEKVGNVSFYDPAQESTFTKPYSEETGKIIDSEVRVLVDQAYRRTIELLTEKKAEVEKIALALLDREVLHQQDVEDLIGKRPYEEKKIFATDTEPVVEEQPAAEVIESAAPEVDATEKGSEGEQNPA